MNRGALHTRLVSGIYTSLFLDTDKLKMALQAGKVSETVLKIPSVNRWLISEFAAFLASRSNLIFIFNYLDIHHRILRWKNYMLAMQNKSVISCTYTFPLVGER